MVSTTNKGIITNKIPIYCRVRYSHKLLTFFFIFMLNEVPETTKNKPMDICFEKLFSVGLYSGYGERLLLGKLINGVKNIWKWKIFKRV